MTDEEQKVAALAAYDEGLPSLLPDDNRYKRRVEQHRHGDRSELHVRTCPVCERNT